MSSLSREAYQKQLKETFNMNRTQILAFKNKPPTPIEAIPNEFSAIHQSKPTKPRPYIPQGMMVEFAKNVADFAAASGKKHIVMLSSLDFGRWQTIDMSSGLQIYYLSSANMDGTYDDCERLWWKRLQEYNPEQRLWKYLSTLAEGNDELGEDDYYPRQYAFCF